ncbi:MAG: NUDIX hydrolase [Actinobacteria bacterium]|nr:NUDIX hydrolase [Actinomycetota bacterium]
MIAIKIRPSVVLINGNTVLLMRYLYGEATVWGIPGGGIADGESLVDTLKRELDEELGVTIDVEELLCIVETPASGEVRHTLHCVFLGKVIGGAPTINPEYTSALAAEWVQVKDIDNIVLYPPVNDVARRSIEGITIPEYLGIRARQWF